MRTNERLWHVTLRSTLVHSDDDKRGQLIFFAVKEVNQTPGKVTDTRAQIDRTKNSIAGWSYIWGHVVAKEHLDVGLARYLVQSIIGQQCVGLSAPLH